MARVEATTLKPKSNWKIDTDVHSLQIFCWVALIAIAIVRAWFTRYAFDGDSVSYMDIGRLIAEGHATAAVHSYWSPGYPVCLSFLWLFHPSVYWECPLVHFVNVLIFVSTLASFQLFWSEARIWHERYASDSGAAIPEYAFWGLGYSIFAVAILNVISVTLVHPDMLVATFCCLAGWSALRFRRAPSVGHALMLGLILALGYYVKAPFFPLGFVFILCASLVWPVSRRRILLGGTALAVFLLVCMPFIAALTRAKHHFTFGESARLSQAFYINGVEHYVHWQGGPPGSGMPVHPTRKLNNFPAIFEFAAKDMGTYPPWFDPTYWYEGITPHFNWKLQWKIFVANLIGEFEIVADAGMGLLCGMILLALLANYRADWTKRFLRFWFVWISGAFAFLMFALVHVESRFLGGWLILLFAGVICACSLPANFNTGRTAGSIAVAVLATAAVALASQTFQEALSTDYDHAASRSRSNVLIANFLLKNGLHENDRVAVIGDGLAAYWAHLARLQVVAEIPANIQWYRVHPALDFWASGPGQQENSLRILAQTGADAVIADPRGFAVPGQEPSIVPSPWRKIDGTEAYVYFFHPRAVT